MNEVFSQIFQPVENLFGVMLKSPKVLDYFPLQPHHLLCMQQPIVDRKLYLNRSSRNMMMMMMMMNFIHVSMYLADANWGHNIKIKQIMNNMINKR